MDSLEIIPGEFIDKTREAFVLLVMRLFVLEVVLLFSHWILTNIKLFLAISVGNFSVFLFFHFLSFVVVAFIILRWVVGETLLTSSQIVLRQGLFVNEMRIYNLQNIEFIHLEQGIWGQLFGFGTLHLYAPTLKEDIYVRNISMRNARTYLKHIQNFIRTHKNLTIIQK